MTTAEIQALQAKNASLERAVSHLTAGALIAHVASRSLHLPTALQDLVETIQQQFGFYHTSLFLLDEQKQNLIMHAAAGSPGSVSLHQGYDVAFAPDSIVGWVAINRTPRVVPNVKEDPTYRGVPQLPHTQAELALPLLTQDHLLGVLDVQSQHKDAFLPEDVTAIQLMADQIALTLENNHLFTALQARLSELESLFALSDVLSTTMDVNEVYRRAARVFAERLRINRVVISEWDKERDSLITKGNFFFDDGTKRVGEYEIEYQYYSLAQFPTSQRVLKNHETLLYQIEDPTLDVAQRELMKEMDVIAVLEIPLVGGQAAMGMVELYRMPNLGSYKPQEIQLAQAMGHETAIALSNARLASEAQARVAELSTLNRFSLAISQAKDVRSVYTAARREVLSMVEATGMSVLLVHPENGTLTWEYGFEYGDEVDLSGVGPLPSTQGFSGHIVRTGEPLLVNERVEEMQRELGSFSVGASSSAWLGVPLKVSDELLGVLTVENGDDPNAFTERDMRLLQTIAGSLAVSIQNELLLEQTRAALAIQSQQSLWLRTAAEVAAAASGMLNVNDLIQAVVNLIPERFDLYYTGLFLIDEETNYAVLQAGTGAVGRLQREQRRRLLVGGNSLIGRATGDGVPRIEQDVTLSREWLYNPNLPLTRAELALPLRTPSRIVGALTVQSTVPNAFGEELVEVLQIMGDQLAVVIDNARLLARAEGRAQQQQLLNEVSAQLYRSADVETIITVGMQALSKHLQISGASLRLGQGETK